MLSFFPQGVLDEILDLIESVSEDFPSYFYHEVIFLKCRILKCFPFNMEFRQRKSRSHSLGQKGSNKRKKELLLHLVSRES